MVVKQPQRPAAGARRGDPADVGRDRTLFHEFRARPARAARPGDVPCWPGPTSTATSWSTLAGQRDVGAVAGGAGELRGAPRDRGRSRRRWWSGCGRPRRSTGLRHERVPRRGAARPRLARARPGGRAHRPAEVAAFEQRALAVGPPTRRSRPRYSTPHHFAHSFIRLRLGLLPTSGARSSTPTPSRGSGTTAGSPARTARPTCATSSASAAPATRWSRTPRGAAARPRRAAAGAPGGLL